MDAVKKARLLLVEDHPLFRKGLAVALANEADLEVVGESTTATEALDTVKRTEVDLAIVDMLMPGRSGISLVPEIVSLQSECKVLALSVIDEPCVIADVLTAGAHGYALKTQPVEQVLEAIHDVLGGVRYLPPMVSADAIQSEMRTTSPRPMDRLTPREREVFELLIRGFSNDEISARLYIARRTVETHRQRITKKLSSHSIVQLQRIVARYGGLDTNP